MTPQPVDPGKATPEFVYALFARGWDSIRIAEYLEIPEAAVVDLLAMYRAGYPRKKRG